MISIEDLNKCIANLAQLSATSTRSDRQLLLEIGYILKQEIDHQEAWNQANNTRGGGVKQIDIQKLLEDNSQLYKENQTLISSVAKLKDIIEHKMPQIQNYLETALIKCDNLNETLEKLG